jgi:hypothetical protein
MKLENVKVGETYTLAIGKNKVTVVVKGVDAKGKIAVASAGGKQITVADAGRLTVRTVVDGVGRPSAKPAAHATAPAIGDGKKERFPAVDSATVIGSGRFKGLTAFRSLFFSRTVGASRQETAPGRKSLSAPERWQGSSPTSNEYADRCR